MPNQAWFKHGFLLNNNIKSIEKAVRSRWNREKVREESQVYVFNEWKDENRITHTQFKHKSHWSCVSDPWKSNCFNWRLNESGNSGKIVLIRITIQNMHSNSLNGGITFPLNVFFLSLFHFFSVLQKPQSQCHGINGISKASQSQWSIFMYMEAWQKHTKFNQKMHPKMKSYKLYTCIVYVV